MITKNIALTIGIGCLTLCAGTAVAQNVPVSGPNCGCWYLGAGLGYSKFHFDDTTPSIPGAVVALSDDDSHWGGKVFGGYQWNKNFAVEVGWVDLGTASQTLNFRSPAIGNITASFKSNGPFADALGILPIGENFSLDAKVGGYYARNSLDFSAGGAIAPFVPAAFAAEDVSTDEDKNEWTWKTGLGARYDFTKHVALRAEWERYFDLDTDHSGGGTDVDLFSLNLLYIY